MLAGLIREDERRVLSGVPGLSDLPVLGHLFATHHKESTQTDIVLTLTPHIVRVLDITENDLRPFRLGRDTGGGAPELPSIQLPPRDRDDLLSPPSPTAAPAAPALPFPQPLQGTLPGAPTTPPKKPGGGGGGAENRIPNP
jgi:general secretion pathway protein D